MTVRLLTVAAFCISADPGAASPYELEGETLRIYGASSAPCVEIELREVDGSGDAPKPEDGPCWVSISFLTPDRSRVAHASGVPFDGSFFVQRPNERGYTVSGRLPIEGRSYEFRASLSTDRRKFEWIEPAKVTLADGRTFQLAGTYAERMDVIRKAAARIGFDKLDAAMLDAYAQAEQALDKDGFAKVQASQRAWLKYRDRPIRVDYDGEVDQNGPGSATHFRMLSDLTALRTDYLRSILETAQGSRDGLYRDGIDRQVRVRFVDDVLVFTLVVDYQPRHVESIFDWRGSITGSAGKDGGDTWIAGAKAISGGDQESVIPERLRFVFAADGTLKLELPSPDDASGHAAALYGGAFRRVRPLEPSEEPLRHWLRLLPEEAFEAVTDPPTQKDTVEIARSGAGGQGFKIAVEGEKHLLMKHPDGEVLLVRFPCEDGGVVVGVEQTNGRNLELAFWQWSATEKCFSPWKAELPKPDPKEFFFRPLTEPETAAVRDHAFVNHSLNRDDWSGVDVCLELGMRYDGSSPDCYVVVEWDGWRFGGFHKFTTR